MYNFDVVETNFLKIFVKIINNSISVIVPSMTYEYDFLLVILIN